MPYAYQFLERWKIILKNGKNQIILKSSTTLVMNI